ncbi:hypothetical protein BCR44DRAFT_1428606 [Catenaria anguillulae PL171]|uniref:Uncharacterized protein n=1 Tax=Catenaria anguillulae PL171 TaxID=765915 RepID=A0A1Y2HVH3_9FUNG|nr:hypothetical protein BCR44DRAFT_1428606 [Catenaria anguillulae PL171]
MMNCPTKTLPGFERAKDVFLKSTIEEQRVGLKGRRDGDRLGRARCRMDAWSELDAMDVASGRCWMWRRVGFGFGLSCRAGWKRRWRISLAMLGVEKGWIEFLCGECDCARSGCLGSGRWWDRGRNTSRAGRARRNSGPLWTVITLVLGQSAIALEALLTTVSACAVGRP